MSVANELDRMPTATRQHYSTFFIHFPCPSNFFTASHASGDESG